MEVALSGVTKTFDGATALHPLDLTITSGSFTTLLGPSGCGKTTLLRLIAGLEQPDSGSIHIGGKTVCDTSKRIFLQPQQRELGMVFQDFALWPHMTVYENVAFGLKARGRRKEVATQVAEAIEAVRLQGFEKRYPHQLSGGQQQRVAFARSIAARASLILFDEPLSALDAMLRDEMREELVQMVRELGVTAVYVTHDQTEAMAMSDTIIVMQQGKVLQRGEPEAIYHTPTHPFVAQFVGRSNWVERDRQMVRPEHIRWTARPGDRVFEGTVSRISYLGDRYEVAVKLTDGTIWTAYHHERMAVGGQVRLGVAEQHIHTLGDPARQTNKATEGQQQHQIREVIYQ
ncbi:ABC transporter ATP-binding protein [Paenibacillus daejeonensis]|uniref:ABC transporter ATP-binding protein n=1 Tax=Paenibacillus daejeonensis TaxID=135193 RepID=UPI0003756A20|nr:ABC transporter ATP-binding protein [Paenibacillus daejeonensis]